MLSSFLFYAVPSFLCRACVERERVTLPGGRKPSLATHSDGEYFSPAQLSAPPPFPFLYEQRETKFQARRDLILPQQEEGYFVGRLVMSLEKEWLCPREDPEEGIGRGCQNHHKFLSVSVLPQKLSPLFGITSIRSCGLLKSSLKGQ